MRRATAIVTVLSLLSGCATVHQCSPTSSDHVLAKLNESLSRSDVTVVLHDGTELSGEDAFVRSDSTYVSVHGRPTNRLHSEVLQQVRLRTADVASISVKRSGRGALRGVGIGLLTGAAVGVAMGAVSPASEVLGWSRGESIAVAAINMGIMGALTGLLVGAGRGARDVYELGDCAEEPADDDRHDSDGGRARPLPN
ncbi:MAG TPA: hypothetical protein VE960_03790 [bacterium]|nr:hypothetical protein [bacterium]